MSKRPSIKGYSLGCPIWGLKDWSGTLYTQTARQKDYLEQYARVFNAVEGNTTFYSTPSEEAVERWRLATPPGFRFSFKLPRLLTHEMRLENAAAEAAEFLERMALLEDRLGPFMIQLPPSFGPDQLPVLDRFLHALPRDFQFAVELRHRGFYEPESAARQVDDLLAARGAERILMDTRAMRSGDAEHPDVVAARHKKPDLPVSPSVLGSRPVLRLVLHPDDEVNEPWIEEWRGILVGWIRQGKRPTVFIHCPNDVHSPRFARRLHRQLARSLDVGTMPPWPGEQEKSAPAQLRLF